MKKIIFLFTILVSVAANAQRTTGVTIANTKVNYSQKTVTFDLSWKGSDASHRDEVWVFVDMQPITGVIKGNWTPATLVPNATTVTAGSGNQYSSLTYTSVSGNTRGVWVKGTSSVTTNTFNATVKVTLASGMPAQFNACAYASDYPPNAVINAGGGYTLKGSPPFTIIYNESSSIITDAKTFNAGCIKSITDATGNPAGIVPALPTVTASASATACTGTAVIFTAMANGGTTTAMTYTWNIAGTSSATTSPTYSKIFSTTGNNTYSVSVQNSNGCVSSVAPVNTVTIDAGAARDEAVSSCGCASGLTACNGYCRDLIADDATCVSNIEVLKATASCRIYPSRTPTKAGWNWASQGHLQSLYNVGYLACAGILYWTSTVIPSGPYAVRWNNCTWQTTNGFSSTTGTCVFVR